MSLSCIYLRGEASLIGVSPDRELPLAVAVYHTILIAIPLHPHAVPVSMKYRMLRWIVNVQVAVLYFSFLSSLLTDESALVIINTLLRHASPCRVVSQIYVAVV